MQGLLLPVPQVTLVEMDKDDLFLEETERGEGGFGSTSELEDKPIIEMAKELSEFSYGGSK